jgi:hypothetical protein
MIKETIRPVAEASAMLQGCSNSQLNAGADVI